MLPTVLAALLALAPVSGAPGVEASGTVERAAYVAVEKVCIPMLRGEVRFDDAGKERAFLASLGLRQGIESDQLALFPPPLDNTLARASLLSGNGKNGRFLMAIGGAERSCRLFLHGPPGATLDPADFAGVLRSESGWSSAEIPAGASPRLGFVKGLPSNPDAAVIIPLSGPPLGIAYRAIIVAR